MQAKWSEQINTIVYHIVSGQSFFSGVALILLAVLLGSLAGRAAGIAASVCFLVGIVGVVASSAAIPVWAYGVWIAVGVCWLVGRVWQKNRIGSAAALALVSIAAAALELPYHIADPIAAVETRNLTVIGDSISAGVGSERATWPEILASTHQLLLIDLSSAGNDTAGAVRTSKNNRRIQPGVVVIEIGGNDVLGVTSGDEFAANLGELLTNLHAPGRQFVMLELPLPPFYHRFAYAQRAAAAKHGVALVPKRVLLAAIAGDDATIDSIHLTDAGHQALAATMWQYIALAYGERSASFPNR